MATNKYLRELIDAAHDNFQTSTDDEAAIRSIPVIINIARSLLAIVEQLQEDVVILRRQLDEHEAIHAAQARTDE